MKNLINYNILLLSFLLFALTNNQLTTFQIKMIPDAYMNATASFVSLDSVEKTSFLYFTYDFDYHNQVNPDQKDIAYFKISTELILSSWDIKFTFLNKSQEEVNSTDLNDLKNKYWKNIFLFEKEKTLNEYNYYIQINKFGKRKTLIFRIPVLKNEGQITIENLYSLPDDILNKFTKINNMNYNGWPQNTEHSHWNENNKHYYEKNKMNLNHYKGHNYNSYPYTLYHSKKGLGYKHYSHHRNIFWVCFQACSIILGYVFFQIWIIIFILYCIVNIKKNNTKLAVIVGNIPE